MGSWIVIFGISFLVFTDLFIILSFASPYWIVQGGAFQNSVKRLGLWSTCDDKHECTWSLDVRKGYQQNLPDWFRATQGLMTVGLSLGLVALIIATLALCCQCKDCNYGCVISGLLVTAFLAIGIAVVVFGVKAADEGTRIDWTESSSFSRFGWSFWLAAGSSGMALLTSFIYCCTCRGHSE